MVTKKTKEKNEAVEKEEISEKERYFYAVGRRKTAVAKIQLFPSKKAQNEVLVNDTKAQDYFPLERLKNIALEALLQAGHDLKFFVRAKVSGGGVSAQAEAIRMGISRALIKYDETLKKVLKDKKFLTRDSREVERKKPGLKKARRAPQWAKR